MIISLYGSPSDLPPGGTPPPQPCHFPIPSAHTQHARSPRPRDVVFPPPPSFSSDTCLLRLFSSLVHSRPLAPPLPLRLRCSALHFFEIYISLVCCFSSSPPLPYPVDLDCCLILFRDPFLFLGRLPCFSLFSSELDFRAFFSPPLDFTNCSPLFFFPCWCDIGSFLAGVPGFLPVAGLFREDSSLFVSSPWPRNISCFRSCTVLPPPGLPRWWFLKLMLVDFFPICTVSSPINLLTGLPRPSFFCFDGAVDCDRVLAVPLSFPRFFRFFAPCPSDVGLPPLLLLK